MVCHCKPPSDGGFGCREECLNRMLNIECVQGTCPCGNLCSNQQVLLYFFISHTKFIAYIYMLAPSIFFFILLLSDICFYLKIYVVQFQKHKYAKFKWFQCGKKGYGLQVLENVSKGQFLIEYVGEVN